jgi:two-component system response regulator HydG
MQVDLLRVLEEKKIMKIGDRAPIPVDFRLISATRKDLEKDVNQGVFREDLFYRVHVITITVPPLRERKEDVPLLAEHFLRKYSHQTTKRVDRIDPEAMRMLKAYDWPGNVRELENAVERAVVLARTSILRAPDFSFLRSAPAMDFKPRSLREIEKEYVLRVLEECDWNVTQASKTLDIHRATLHKMMKRLGLRRP